MADMEFANNLMKLKKCNKIYTVVFYIYLLLSIILIAFSFLSIVIGTWDTFLVENVGAVPLSRVVYFLVADALPVAPLAFYLAYRGTMLHHDLSVVFDIALLTLNGILFIALRVNNTFYSYKLPYYVFIGYSVICIIASVFNLKANITYHWLEEQEGFPQFNERLQEQDIGKFQWEHKNPYEMEMDRRKKEESDSMNDLAVSNEQLEQSVHEYKPSDMDSL